MPKFTLAKARSQFGRPIAMVEAGEEVTITKGSKAVARLVQSTELSQQLPSLAELRARLHPCAPGTAVMRPATFGAVMIKNVGGTKIKFKHRASCHCGTVVLELDLPDGIVDPRRCDCSICRRKGAIVASVPLAGIKIIQGEDALRLYEFNTHTAKHYFCSRCGIYTHHQRRSNPDEYGYNVGCLDGVNPYDLGEVSVNDGINHPADMVND